MKNTINKYSTMTEIYQYCQKHGIKKFMKENNIDEYHKNKMFYENYENIDVATYYDNCYRALTSLFVNMIITVSCKNMSIRTHIFDINKNSDIDQFISPSISYYGMLFGIFSPQIDIEKLNNKLVEIYVEMKYDDYIDKNFNSKKEFYNKVKHTERKELKKCFKENFEMLSLRQMIIYFSGKEVADGIESLLHF